MLLSTLLLSLAPAIADYEIDQTTLDRLSDEVVPVMKVELGISLPDGLTVTIATHREIEKALIEENTKLLLRSTGSEEAARDSARTFAKSISHTLLAKYRLGGAKILVNPKAFRMQAEMIGVPELNSEETLRAVLVHEIAHAASDELFGMWNILLTLESPDQIQAYNAVMEGYAQMVARRVCAANGWSKGFDTFTRSVGKLPVDAEAEGAAVAYFMRVQSALLASWYREGEIFMQALLELGGPEAVERAFRQPPVDSAVITEPEWFLNPEKRPELAFDLDASLDIAAEAFPEEEWVSQRTSLTNAQLRAALAPVGEEATDSALENLRNARAQSFTPKASVGSKMIQLGLYEFATAADARAFVVTLRAMSEAKDEAMKEGQIRILDAVYEEVQRPEFDGLIVAKTVSAMGQELPVVTLIGSHGPLCVELLFSNEEPDVEDSLTVAAEAIRNARAIESTED